MKKLFLIFLFMFVSDLSSMSRSHESWNIDSLNSSDIVAYECVSVNDLSSIDSRVVCYLCWANINCCDPEGNNIIKFVKCGHLFHKKCLEYLESIEECPACNRD